MRQGGRFQCDVIFVLVEPCVVRLYFRTPILCCHCFAEIITGFYRSPPYVSGDFPDTVLCRAHLLQRFRLLWQHRVRGMNKEWGRNLAYQIARNLTAWADEQKDGAEGGAGISEAADS